MSTSAKVLNRVIKLVTAEIQCHKEDIGILKERIKGEYAEMQQSLEKMEVCEEQLAELEALLKEITN